MSARVRSIFEPYFALNDSFPIGKRRVQKVVKELASRARISVSVTPHVPAIRLPASFSVKAARLRLSKRFLVTTA